MVDSANSSASPILYKYVSIIGLRRILEDQFGSRSQARSMILLSYCQRSSRQSR